MTKTLLSLGHGYSASWLADRLLPQGWRVIGTTRDPAKADVLRSKGIDAISWDRDAVAAALQDATHVLSSVSPKADGDPALDLVGDVLQTHATRFEWVGYLSTTGVYGDHDGAWVDETMALSPSTTRGQQRVLAEAAWQALGTKLEIFRLAGIYGPGRGPFSKVRAGTAQRIIKPGQVFSRIHVADIARVLEASIAAPKPGAIYNVCDNDPAPPQDVISYAAQLLEVALPPKVDFDTAELSPMARSFYAENKRVSNDRITQELGVSLLYPDYRTGLQALLKEELSKMTQLDRDTATAKTKV